MNQVTSSYTIHSDSVSGWPSMIDQKLTEALELLEPSLRQPLTATLHLYAAEEEASDSYTIPGNWHHLLLLPVMNINCHVG